LAEPASTAKDLFLNSPTNVVPVRSHSLSSIKCGASLLDFVRPRCVYIWINFTLKTLDESSGDFSTFLLGQP